MANFFIYQADVWCYDDGEAIREKLRRSDKAPPDEDDERSFDSDDYPKGPYDGEREEADSPQHCAAGADCLNAEVLHDGSEIGQWLENPLTEYGLKHLRGEVLNLLRGTRIRGSAAVLEFWRNAYADEIGTLHEVAVGEETVYQGFDDREAESAFTKYAEQSDTHRGKAANELVKWFHDGKLWEEFDGRS